MWKHSQYRFAYYLQKLHNEFHPQVVADYAILFLKSEENIFSWNQFDEFLHEEFRQRLTLNIKHSQLLKPQKIIIAQQLDFTAARDYYLFGQFFIVVSRAFTKMSHYRSDVVNEALLENALKSFEKVNQVEIVSMKVENATGEGENFIGDLASVKFMAKLSVEENQEQFKVIWSKSKL